MLLLEVNIFHNFRR